MVWCECFFLDWFSKHAHKQKPYLKLSLLANTHCPEHFELFSLTSLADVAVD